ncbi:unnamed protein product [Trichobilharzia regenti]|nr:unnamed protein product [Trichobilharzia regenti]
MDCIQEQSFKHFVIYQALLHIFILILNQLKWANLLDCLHFGLLLLVVLSGEHYHGVFQCHL